jgi:hypothetical protein
MTIKNQIRKRREKALIRKRSNQTMDKAMVMIFRLSKDQYLQLKLGFLNSI